jgi:hypothetical protein
MKLWRGMSVWIDCKGVAGVSPAIVLRRLCGIQLTPAPFITGTDIDVPHELGPLRSNRSVDFVSNSKSKRVRQSLPPKSRFTRPAMLCRLHGTFGNIGHFNIDLQVWSFHKRSDRCSIFATRPRVPRPISCLWPLRNQPSLQQ